MAGTDRVILLASVAGISEKPHVARTPCVVSCPLGEIVKPALVLIAKWLSAVRANHIARGDGVMRLHLGEMDDRYFDPPPMGSVTDVRAEMEREDRWEDFEDHCRDFAAQEPDGFAAVLRAVARAMKETA